MKTLQEFQMHNVTVPFLPADTDVPIIMNVPELAWHQFSLLAGPQRSGTPPPHWTTLDGDCPSGASWSTAEWHPPPLTRSLQLEAVPMEPPCPQQSGDVPLSGPLQSDGVPLEPQPLDREEERKVQEFSVHGCRCRWKCSAQFNTEHYRAARANAAELSWNELNMAVMGQVMALTCCDQLTKHSTVHRHAPTEWQKATVLFHHHGQRVCRRTFLFLHGISDTKFKAIKEHYLSTGLVPRTHGHTGRIGRIGRIARIAPNALVQKDVEQVLSFITHYTETNAILLPGRIPGCKRDDIQLLPSTTTKKAVWRLYQETCASLLVRAAGYSTFCKVWRHFLPHVIVARPMTDLCWTCQQNSTAIICSAGLSEAEKSEVRELLYQA